MTTRQTTSLASINIMSEWWPNPPSLWCAACFVRSQRMKVLLPIAVPPLSCLLDPCSSPLIITP
jgi:hypothetical protein